MHCRSGKFYFCMLHYYVFTEASKMMILILVENNFHSLHTTIKCDNVLRVSNVLKFSFPHVLGDYVCRCLVTVARVW